MSTTVIILAAGKGTRMRSKLPKVLQPLAGQPLLGHVIQTAKQLQAQNIITIYGHGGDLVKDAFSHEQIQWVEQAEQLGTGHAVQVTLPVLPQDGISLILYGDVPLVRQQTLEQLLDASSQTGIGMITLTVDNPTGYGRIVRENGQIQAIVEHKDASDAQRQIQEINTGIYCVSNAKLHEWLPKLSNNNAQGEYYLTDIVEMAVAEGLEIASIQPEQAFEVEGVNDRIQLAALEREFQAQQALELMRQGVTLTDFRVDYPWWESQYPDNLYFDNWEREGFVECDPSPGCMGIMQVESSKWNHAGIITEEGELLHHLYGQPSCVTPYARGYFKDRTMILLRSVQRLAQHSLVRAQVQQGGGEHITAQARVAL